MSDSNQCFGTWKTNSGGGSDLERRGSYHLKSVQWGETHESALEPTAEALRGSGLGGVKGKGGACQGRKQQAGCKGGLSRGTDPTRGLAWWRWTRRGQACLVSLCFTLLRFTVFSTNGRRDPPTSKIVRLTLWQYFVLRCSGTEPTTPRSACTVLKTGDSEWKHTYPAAPRNTGSQSGGGLSDYAEPAQ